MKNKILITLIIILFSNCGQSQNIFFQYHNKLWINNKEIKIKIGSIEYNIYDGVVSPEGEYICGEIKDKNIQTNKEYDTCKTNDFFKYDSSRIILFSRNSDTVVFDVFFKGFPELMFSNNGKYLLFSKLFDNSILIKTKDGLPLYSFSEHFKGFNWINGDLYFLVSIIGKCFFAKLDLKDKDVNVLSNIKITDIHTIYEIPKEFLKSTNCWGCQIVDTTKILMLSHSDTEDVIEILENENIVASFKFSKIEDIKYFQNSIFIKGNLVESDEYNKELYRIDLENQNIISLFCYDEVKKFNDNFESTILDFFVTGEDIYFIVSILLPLPEYNNIIVYNMKNKSFKRITLDGFISQPMGTFTN